MMRKLIYILSVGLALCLSESSIAAICSNSKGQPDNINYDITRQLEASGNAAGYTFNIEKSSDNYIGVYAVCPPGVGVNYTYRSYLTTYPVVSVEGKYQYLKLNDYLQAAISINDSYAGVFYPPAQYIHMGTDENVNKNEKFEVQDSNLNFHFKLVKPFVGTVSYAMTPAFLVYVTTRNTDPLTTVVYSVSYSGNITVPQSCELNAGQVIAMDFGNIGANMFTQAGAGHKPAGVNPQTRTVGIQCKNIDAQALLSLRLEASNVSGNAVISDNKDLGFVIGDGNKEPLIPNNINSNIPFQLDDNGSASVPITAWPVSVTGNRPAEGKFIAEGYLRVDFD